MNLARMMTDKVFFEDSDGIRRGPYKTRFGSERITVFQDALDVREGDRVIQPLPDGSEQAYVVQAISHNAARRNIPAHFSITLAQDAAKEAADTAARQPAAQAGSDAGGDSVAALLHALADGIDNGRFPEDRKDEARRLLRDFTSHPVVVAVLASIKPSC